MSIAKAVLLFLAVFIYIVFGLMLQIFFAPVQRFFFDRGQKQFYRIISHWTKLMCVYLRRILGIRLSVEGNISSLKERGNFIVSNHQTYLDGVILAGLFPVVFVSKLQVKSWPIFGLMAQLGGTIFIDRQRKLKSVDSLEKIAKALKNKINVLLFPEGTSTDGNKILAFQSVFFQAPLNSGSPVLPVTIEYMKRDRVCWYGQISFFAHLLQVLKLRDIEAKVFIHPKIEVSSFLNQPDGRKQLSEVAHEVIAG